MDNRSIFVIGAWPDTKEKEKVLLNKIRFLKEKQYPICLVTHYPVDIKVQELCDYYIYEKENVLSVNWRLSFWRINNGVRQDRISNVDYHGVACLMNIRNAVDFLLIKDRYRTIHYVEADLEYDFDKYMTLFNENNSDDKFAFFIHYQDNMYRTDLFSCDIKWYNSIIPRCQSWEEFTKAALNNNYILEYWFGAIVNSKTKFENIIFVKDFNVDNRWTQSHDVDWDEDTRPILDFTSAPRVFHESKIRHNSFKKVLELLYKNKKTNPLIVEVGVTRNFGDLGDGDSTSIWAWYISTYGGSYHGCDINKNSLNECVDVLRKYITGSDRSTFVKLTESDGVEFLRNLQYNNIDLLYLDTVDWVKGSHDSGFYHLKLLLQGINKISIGGMIMFDDTFNVETFEGKAEFAIPYLLEHPKFTCLHRGYQFIFRRDY